jgi:hypothetical protein
MPAQSGNHLVILVRLSHTHIGMSVPQRHPLKSVQSCFPWPVSRPAACESGVAPTGSEQLAREGREPLIAAVAPRLTAAQAS